MAHEVYQGPSQGPFRCGHCQHAERSGTVCHQPDAVAWILAHDPHRRIDARGVLARIEPFGCCDFYQKVLRG